MERAALLTIDEVRNLVKMGKSWIYAEAKAGRFPAPIRLSYKASRWNAGQIYDYLTALAERGHANSGQAARPCISSTSAPCLKRSK